MRFSRRTPSDLRPNRFSRVLSAARATGRPLLDLTVSNPTIAGFVYPPDLLRPLAEPASLVYEPHPFGLASAREAVSADYRRRGVALPADRIVLTASTSEAYSLLFKLLCDPGDRVLVPRPSYPLFEYLTRLDGVEADSYSLEYHGRWSLDVESVRAAITPSTRAVLAVSPNNPTGSFLSPDDLASLAALCEQHGLALIGDEVFADYRIAEMPRAQMPSVLSVMNVLSFGLGGLSKSAGLPQMKLGWIGVSGPAALVSTALARLEIICDSYLSVSTPVQQAAGALLATGAATRAAIAERIGENHDRLVRAAGRYPACSPLAVEGGWYAAIQVPATRSEDDLIISLLEEDDVVVHPGYFYDFAREAFLVVSLLPPPGVFTEAIERVLDRASA